MDTSELVIDTKGLSKTYNGVAALDALNLQVPKNSIFGFLGPNGAGSHKAAAGTDPPLVGRRRNFWAGHRPGQRRDSQTSWVSGPGPPLLRAYDRSGNAALQGALLLSRTSQ